MKSNHICVKIGRLQGQGRRQIKHTLSRKSNMLNIVSKRFYNQMNKKTFLNRFYIYIFLLFIPWCVASSVRGEASICARLQRMLKDWSLQEVLHSKKLPDVECFSSMQAPTAGWEENRNHDSTWRVARLWKEWSPASHKARNWSCIAVQPIMASHFRVSFTFQTPDQTT